MSGRALRSAATVLAALLAACNSGDGGNNGSSANGATRAPQPPAPPPAQAMRPGQWESTTRVASVAPLDMSPEAADQIRSQPLPAPEIERSCLSAASIANPIEYYRGMLIQSRSGASCGPARGTFANGRIRFTLSCDIPEQGNVNQALVGSYTADTMQLAASGVVTAQVPATGETVRLRVETVMSARRLGECPAGATAD